MEIKITNIVQNKNVFYTVKYDDTIENIAKTFEVPKEYILQNNKGNLYQGKILFLPETHFRSHIVAPFETLEIIANHTGVSVESLKSKNNLTNDYIFVGQKLYI